MWNRNKTHIKDEDIDRFGEQLLRAFEASQAEINTAATSPFLYRRIRVRIEAEERQRSEVKGKWFELLTEAKHAIPVLTMIAVMAIGLVWYSPAFSTSNPNGLNLSTNPSYAQVLAEIPGLSSDEMMASFVGYSERPATQPKEQR